MCTVIALTNQKGGVGKTTSSSALASGLCLHYQKKVLAIDLDPQGNLGFSLGLDIEGCHTVYDVLVRSHPIVECIYRTSTCDVIPSNILLSGLESETSGADRAYTLKKAISSVAHLYDFVVIDTPPALNILTVNAYTASDHLIIPMGSDILSLMGVTQLKETIDSVKNSYNPALNLLGILLTRFNAKTLLAQEVKEMAENIASQMRTSVFDTQIRSSVYIAEAPAHGVSIYEYSPRSNPTKDYTDFVSEVVAKLNESF